MSESTTTAGSPNGGAGRRESVAELLKDLRDETTLLLRQEVALAKTEITEKMSRIARNAGYAVAGALVAFLGLVFVLQAVAALIGLGLASAGVNERTALWLAPLILGLVIAVIGAVLVMKGIKAVKQETLVPEKTMNSLKEDKAWIQQKAT